MTVFNGDINMELNEAQKILNKLGYELIYDDMTTDEMKNSKELDIWDIAHIYKYNYTPQSWKRICVAYWGLNLEISEDRPISYKSVSDLRKYVNSTKNGDKPIKLNSIELMKKLDPFFIE